MNFTSLRIPVFLLLTISLPVLSSAYAQDHYVQQNQAQENRNVARLVAWKPKPGMDREFQEGYKRHLEWHRKNGDTWTWHGWMLISGERDGTFLDGTFFHQWTDLDAPVSPAGDGADNAVNVEPYAEVRSVASYEAVSALSNLTPKHFNSPLLTFCYIEVAPGRAAQFEARAAQELRELAAKVMPHAVLRPVNGTSEYLLLLPAEKLSELGSQAAFITRLLQSVASDPKYPAMLARFRTETARHRLEMSYIPLEKPNSSSGK